MSSEAKVGAFVVVSLIVFVYTFITVANKQLAGEKVTYKTYFTFAAGRDPGTAVRFGGLKAGVVEEVRSWEEDQTKVEVIFEMRGDIPVNTDSVAKLASLSALGQNYLEITTGSIEAPRIEPGGIIKSEEAVTVDDIMQKFGNLADTATDMMEDMRGDITRITERAEVLLNNLNEITGEKNRESMEQLLENANEMMAEQRPKINRITDQVTEMLVKADRLLVDFQAVAEQTKATVANANRTLDETREPLKSNLVELEATLKQTRRTLEDIQAIVVVNESNINEMLENLRVSSQNLKEMSDELRQRPWSLIRVKPKPDRKVPLPAPGG